MGTEVLNTLEDLGHVLRAFDYLDHQPREDNGYHSTAHYIAMRILEEKATELADAGMLLE